MPYAVFIKYKHLGHIYMKPLFIVSLKFKYD